MVFKTIKSLVAILLFMSLFAPSVFAAQLAYKIHVDGLSCPFCAYGLEKKLGAVKGVERIDVDIASGTAIVTMEEGAILDETTAKNAVKEAGFSLHSFEQTQSSSQQGRPQDQKK